MEIGKRIIYYRKLLGLTQEDVAIRLNTTPQNIYKYEKGIIKNIPLSAITLMAELFGISPAELAGMSDSTDKPATDDSPSAEKVAFGKRLRYKREERGFSLRDFAIKLHVIPSVINEYENGSFDQISDTLLRNISKLLDTPIDFFKNGEVPEGFESLTLNETEKLVILNYRNKPQYHDAIHQLLGISPDNAPRANEPYRYKTLTSSDFDTPATRGRIAQTQMGVYHTEKKTSDDK